MFTPATTCSIYTHTQPQMEKQKNPKTLRTTFTLCTVGIKCVKTTTNDHWNIDYAQGKIFKDNLQKYRLLDHHWTAAGSPDRKMGKSQYLTHRVPPCVFSCIVQVKLQRFCRKELCWWIALTGNKKHRGGSSHLQEMAGHIALLD